MENKESKKLLLLALLLVMGNTIYGAEVSGDEGKEGLVMTEVNPILTNHGNIVEKSEGSQPLAVSADDVTNLKILNYGSIVSNSENGIGISIKNSTGIIIENTGYIAGDKESSGATDEVAGGIVIESSYISSLINTGNVFGAVDGITIKGSGEKVENEFEVDNFENHGIISTTGDEGIEFNETSVDKFNNRGNIRGLDDGLVVRSTQMNILENSGNIEHLESDTTTETYAGIFIGYDDSSITELKNSGQIRSKEQGVLITSASRVDKIYNDGLITGGNYGEQVSSVRLKAGLYINLGSYLENLENKGTIRGDLDGINYNTSHSTVEKININNSGRVTAGATNTSDGIYINYVNGSFDEILNKGLIETNGSGDNSDGIALYGSKSLDKIINKGRIKAQDGDNGIFMYNGSKEQIVENMIFAGRIESKGDPLVIRNTQINTIMNSGSLKSTADYGMAIATNVLGSGNEVGTIENLGKIEGEKAAIQARNDGSNGTIINSVNNYGILAGEKIVEIGANSEIITQINKGIHIIKDDAGNITSITNGAYSSDAISVDTNGDGKTEGYYIKNGNIDGTVYNDNSEKTLTATNSYITSSSLNTHLENNPSSGLIEGKISNLIINGAGTGTTGALTQDVANVEISNSIINGFENALYMKEDETTFNGTNVTLNGNVIGQNDSILGLVSSTINGETNLGTGATLTLKDYSIINGETTLKTGAIFTSDLSIINGDTVVGNDSTVEINNSVINGDTTVGDGTNEGEDIKVTLGQTTVNGNITIGSGATFETVGTIINGDTTVGEGSKLTLDETITNGELTTGNGSETTIKNSILNESVNVGDEAILNLESVNVNRDINLGKSAHGTITDGNLNGGYIGGYDKELESDDESSLTLAGDTRVFNEISGVKDLNIEGNVTLFEEAQLENIGNVNLEDGDLTLRVDPTQKDEDGKLIGHGLYDSGATINKGDGDLTIGLNGIGKDSYLSLGENTTISEGVDSEEKADDNLITNSLILEAEYENSNTIKITIKDNICPEGSANDIYTSIYEALETGKLKDFTLINEDRTEEKALEELLLVLEQMYANNPYAYTLKSNRDSIKLFEDNRSIKPEITQWIVTGRGIYTGIKDSTTTNDPSYYIGQINGVDVNNGPSTFNTKTNTYGGVATFEYGLTNDTSIGMLFGGATQNVDFIGASTIDSNSLYVGTFVDTEIKNFRFKAGLGYQYSSNDVDAAYGVGGNYIRNNENYDVNTMHGYIEGRYTGLAEKNKRIEPKIKLSYYYVAQDEITEKYSSYTLAMNYDKEEASTFDIELGIDVTHDFYLENGKLSSILSLSGIYSGGDTRKDLTGRSIGDENLGTDFTVQGAEISEVSGKIAYNLEYEKENGFIGVIGASYEFSDSENSNLGASIGIGYRFK